MSEHSDSSDPWRAFVTVTKSDCVCLPRRSLCLFQVTPDLEVLRPSKEGTEARKGCCLQACLEIATLVARGCWQEVSYKPCPSSLTEHKQPSSVEHSDETTKPLRPLRAGMWTSLGSATKINSKQLWGGSC